MCAAWEGPESLSYPEAGLHGAIWGLQPKAGREPHRTHHPQIQESSSRARSERLGGLRKRDASRHRASSRALHASPTRKLTDTHRDRRPPGGSLFRTRKPGVAVGASLCAGRDAPSTGVRESVGLRFPVPRSLLSRWLLLRGNLVTETQLDVDYFR